MKQTPVVVILVVVAVLVCFSGWAIYSSPGGRDVKPPVAQISATEKHDLIVAIATKGDYVLTERSMVWSSGLDIMHFVDLSAHKGNVVSNYFDSLVEKKRAYYAPSDTSVTIVDAVYYRNIELVKLRETGTGAEGWAMKMQLLSVPEYKKRMAKIRPKV